MTTHVHAQDASPRHHLPEWLLWSYAHGGVSEGESLLVATHASLCVDCLARIEQLEGVAGALLDAEARAPLSEDLLSRTLAKLQLANAPLAKPVPPPRDPMLPGPLARIVGPYEQIQWKRAFEGLFYIDLPLVHGAVPVRLRRLPPNMKIAKHSHRGSELEMVLAGGVVDLRDGRRFLRGDVASNDESDTHTLLTDPDGECVVLGVQDDRVAPKGLWSRLVFGYLGW
jgi:putative transcriptional regulator